MKPRKSEIERILKLAEKVVILKRQDSAPYAEDSDFSYYQMTEDEIKKDGKKLKIPEASKIFTVRFLRRNDERHPSKKDFCSKCKSSNCRHINVVNELLFKSADYEERRLHIHSETHTEDAIKNSVLQKVSRSMNNREVGGVISVLLRKEMGKFLEGNKSRLEFDIDNDSPDAMYSSLHKNTGKIPVFLFFTMLTESLLCAEAIKLGTEFFSQDDIRNKRVRCFDLIEKIRKTFFKNHQDFSAEINTYILFRSLMAFFLVRALNAKDYKNLSDSLSFMKIPSLTLSSLGDCTKIVESLDGSHYSLGIREDFNNESFSFPQLDYAVLKKDALLKISEDMGFYEFIPVVLDISRRIVEVLKKQRELEQCMKLRRGRGNSMSDPVFSIQVFEELLEVKKNAGKLLEETIKAVFGEKEYYKAVLIAMSERLNTGGKNAPSL
ncbi:MAG: hypothetical protein DDT19_01499 [Syntrophomonadaceae bacterium]|nr:hypothetical protein [Bacillota bacterium]